MTTPTDIAPHQTGSGSASKAAPHPSPLLYVKLAGILAVLTAIEVGLFYLEDDLGAPITVPTLLILAILKFVLVVGYYMHLRYEKPLLPRFFAIGFLIALGCYAMVLGTFGVIAIYAN